MKQYYKKALLYWAPFAVVITIFAGLIYVAVHQHMRQGANDPQIQVSEDVANALSQGAQPQDLIPSNGTTEIEKTLATYVVIFDENGKPVAYSAQLNGAAPTPPEGVFKYTSTHNQDRITWQPKAGVREAVVITRYSSPAAGGFVMAGRSLREVEKRTGMLTLEVASAWVLSLAVSLAALFYFVIQNATNESEKEDELEEKETIDLEKTEE